MINWSEAYIGTSYLDLGRTPAGVDCWGLVHLVYAEIAGITVPSYADGYADWQETTEISGLIGKAKQSPFWRALKSVEAVQALDLVVLRTGRLDTHIGIVVQPGAMLHILEQRPAHIERYDTGIWSPRRTGIWRHVKMEGRSL